MAGGDGASDSLLGHSSTPWAPRYVQDRGCGPRRPHGTGPQMARLLVQSRCPPVPADLPGAPKLEDLFPGGPGCVYQGTCFPDPPAGGIVQPDLEEDPSAWIPGQERSGEYSTPLAGAPPGAPIFHQQWTRVTGIVGSQVRIRDGIVFVSSRPGPLTPADVDHVALAGRVGGADFSNESVLSSFPYLQLIPPHCLTCLC